MKITSTSIAGVVTVNTIPIADDRGAFSRLFCECELDPAIGDRHIVQINYSRTFAVGAVRGLHFQYPPHAEMKLVRCLKGRVWDVALDLRRGSPTFLHWHAEELTTGPGRMLIIPEGCAHGFQVLEPNSELLYLHTAAYALAAEGAVAFDDRSINIPWPLPVTEISARDAAHPPLSPDFPGIAL